jgi:hypothetical protein
MTAEILAATEHLVLRRMTNDAAAALAAYRSDPVQARYQSWETPYPKPTGRLCARSSARYRRAMTLEPGAKAQVKRLIAPLGDRWAHIQTVAPPSASGRRVETIPWRREKAP